MRFSKWCLLFVLPAMACGDGDGPTRETTTTVPPASVTTVIGEGSGSLGSQSFRMVSGQTNVRGGLELVVDWTFDDSRLNMYVTDGGCTPEQFQRDVCPNEPACECNFLVRSETSQPKPRRLRVDNHLGPFALIVWNVGSRDESFSYQALLTTTSTTTLRTLSRSLGALEPPVDGQKPSIK